MIKLCIYFHTKQGELELPPKMAFERGVVSMPTNHKHGIRASDSERVYFSKTQNSLMEAVKKCLGNHGVKLVKDEKIKDFKKFLEMKKNQDFFNVELDI